MRGRRPVAPSSGHDNDTDSIPSRTETTAERLSARFGRVFETFDPE